MIRATIMAAGLALGATLPTAPAQAAESVSRTFVSAAGSDSNNCANVMTPCRHLANAYAVTAPNGEIYVLDPANYGSLTIVGPVSIEGHGWASIAPVTGQAAITINANAGDKINIIGVVLDGTGLTGTTGIKFNSGGSLIVRDSVIRNFGSDGIDFLPTGNNTASTSNYLSVSNTLVSDNANIGIDVAPTGAGFAVGVLEHVQLENNGSDGLSAVTAGKVINFTVTDSVSSHNGGNGVSDTSNGTVVNIVVRNSTIANNVQDGLITSGANALMRVTRSTITGNGTGWSSEVESYDDNDILANANNNTAPAAIPYK